MRPPPGGGSQTTGAPVVARAVTAMTRLGAGQDSLSPVSQRGSLADMPLLCPTCQARYPGEFKVCPRDATELVGAAGEQVVDELVGTTIHDTYQIVRVIGEGGMGRVYEARHTRIPQKRYAIKTLHPEFSRHPEVLSRFQREVEAAASIKSPYVMEVYDVDKTEDGRPFMVGEFLEGRELADHLGRVGKLGVGPSVRIVRQLCAGLGMAHTLGIVHRDMKPENVFLTGDLAKPIAKVIDFGISKTGDTPGSQLTKTGMIMGTPSFMAPEQAKGEHVTLKADVYAVGAILYTLVTGRRPFDKPDTTATLTAVLLEEPPRPRSIEATIPDGLEAIIQHAMAKDPAQRYGSLAELDDDLAPYDDAGRVGTAHTMLAGSSSFSLTGLGGARDVEASTARPMFKLLASVGAFFAVGLLLTLVSSVVRIARGSDAQANLTGTEAVAIIVLLAVSLAAPTYLAIAHLQKAAWQNTARVVDLVKRFRWPVLVGLSAYGLGSLLVRVVETVVLRRAVGAAWPVWDLLMVIFGAVGAAVTYRIVGKPDSRASMI
jgi:serine/threonine-protein kinase